MEAIEIINEIQQDITLGSTVKITLINGTEYIGVLEALSISAVALRKDDGGLSKIRPQMIGVWEQLEQSEPAIAEEQAVIVNAEKKADITQDMSVDVERELMQIEVEFNTKCQHQELTPQEPVFDYQSIATQADKHFANLWHGINQSYQSAKKINELDPKFQRVQKIASKLDDLCTQYPTVPLINARLGYLYLQSEKYQLAFERYSSEIAYFKSNIEGETLINTAYLAAVKLEKPMVALYLLECFFIEQEIASNLELWFYFIGLVAKADAIALLAKFKDKVPNSAEDLYRALVYLFKQKGDDEAAVNLVLQKHNGESIDSICHEMLTQLAETKLPEGYFEAQHQFLPSKVRSNKVLTGVITSYLELHGYGFIQTEQKQDYFFHLTGVKDETLKHLLVQDKYKAIKTAVEFELSLGVKGDYVAVEVKQAREPAILAKLVKEHLAKGDASNAGYYLKELTTKLPQHPEIREFKTQLAKFTNQVALPQGYNPYAIAKRLMLATRELEKAIDWFEKAIAENDHKESAVKDLAMLLQRLERPDEAITLLKKHRSKMQDKVKIDNLLIMLYETVKDESSIIQYMANNHLTTRRKEILLWKIAVIYAKKQQYQQAEDYYRQAIELSPGNLVFQRNLAQVLIPQNRHDKAQQILEQLLRNNFDNQAYVLLQQIKSANETGDTSAIDSIEFDLSTESTYLTYSGSVSDFAIHFVDNADLGVVVPANRLEQGRYVYDKDSDIDYDLKQVSHLVKTQKTKRPAARAQLFLAAANILITTDRDVRDINYNLHEAFAALGDAALTDSLSLDTVRQFYLESLALYSKLENRQDRESQIAINSLVRYLYSTHDNKTLIPPLGSDLPSVTHVLEELALKHTNTDKLITFIALLIVYSSFAERKILKTIYTNHTLREYAINYLSSNGIAVTSKETSNDKAFYQIWHDYKTVYFDKHRYLESQLSTLHEMNLTTHWLENCVTKLGELRDIPQLLSLESTRIDQLIALVELCLFLLESTAYETQESQIERCHSAIDILVNEINTSPTRLSIEQLLPFLLNLKPALTTYSDQLFDNSKPQVELRLAKDFETVTPVDNTIEVQIVVTNSHGRSPADELKLMVVNTSLMDSLQIYAEELSYGRRVLRGGQQSIIKFPITVSDEVINEGAFSLSLKAVYKTVRGEDESTIPQNFQINIGSHNDFEEIDNPYSVGAIVQDPKMVYGRDRLIQSIVSKVAYSKEESIQGYCFAIYGQKRIGKSTVLYYLGRELKKVENNIVVDVGNIGSIFSDNQDSETTFNLFLWQILTKLKTELQQLVRKRVIGEFDIFIPSTSTEFLTAPSPLGLFNDIFEQIKVLKASDEQWQGKQIIILIDEFTYLYTRMKQGKISREIMTNWKAFLQSGFFNAILVGQDFMPKFVKEFGNEFTAVEMQIVSYLATNDALALIEKPCPLNGDESRFREKATDAILTLTANSPFYIQIICKKLIDYINEKKAPLITEAYVEDVKNQLIDELGLGTFDNLYNSEDGTDNCTTAQDALKVLQEIAQRSRTTMCSKAAIKAIDIAHIDKVLADLLSRDVIAQTGQNGEYYQIKVGLFKEWLLHHGS